MGVTLESDLVQHLTVCKLFAYSRIGISWNFRFHGLKSSVFIMLMWHSLIGASSAVLCDTVWNISSTCTHQVHAQFNAHTISRKLSSACQTKPACFDNDKPNCPHHNGPSLIVILRSMFFMLTMSLECSVFAMCLQCKFTRLYLMTVVRIMRGRVSGTPRL